MLRRFRRNIQERFIGHHKRILTYMGHKRANSMIWLVDIFWFGCRSWAALVPGSAKERELCMSIRCPASSCADATYYFRHVRVSTRSFQAFVVVRSCWGHSRLCSSWSLATGREWQIAHSPLPSKSASNGYCILCGLVRPAAEGASAFPPKRLAAGQWQRGNRSLLRRTCVPGNLR